MVNCRAPGESKGLMMSGFRVEENVGSNLVPGFVRKKKLALFCSYARKREAWTVRAS